MKIKSRIYLVVILSVLLIISIIFYSLFAYQTIKRETSLSQIASQFRSDLSELDVVMYEYLLHGETRMKVQWLSKYDSMWNYVTELNFSIDSGLILLPEPAIKKSSTWIEFEKMITIFTSIVDNDALIEQTKDSEIQMDKYIYLKERLVSQLLVTSQIVSSDFATIEENAIQRTRSAQDQTINIIIVMTFVVALLVMGIGVWSARSISEPLTDLMKGTSKLAEGNFSHKIKPQSNDELGQLAKEFDSMRVRIQKSNKNLKKYNVELESRVKSRTSELNESNKKTERYARSLEKANDLKDLFTDIMHHDMKNPITVLKAMTDVKLIKKEPGDLKYLKMVSENIDRMQNIVDFASEYAVIMSHKKLPKENLDLKIILAQAVKDVHSRAVNAGMKITNKVQKSMPIHANKMLSEIFLNFMTNAIKYARNGKSIIVDAHATKNNYIIHIIDFGVGVPDKYKKTIFSRFDRAEARGIKGSGLGLGIVKKIVHLHKGDVWVEDNPAGGSIFVVQLPKK